jgi:hypothetical protein
VSCSSTTETVIFVDGECFNDPGAGGFHLRLTKVSDEPAEGETLAPSPTISGGMDAIVLTLSDECSCVAVYTVV